MADRTRPGGLLLLLPFDGPEGRKEEREGRLKVRLSVNRDSNGRGEERGRYAELAMVLVVFEGWQRGDGSEMTWCRECMLERLGRQQEDSRIGEGNGGELIQLRLWKS